MRWGDRDMNNVNDTCYNTCAQFLDGNQQDIAQSECGQKCNKCWQQMAACKGKNECSLRNKVPVIRLLPRIFKGCLDETQDKEKALKCCLSRCGSYEEQEMCMTAYNALQKSIYEPFLSPGNDNTVFITILIIIVIGYYMYNKRKGF
jgi:hypothetical protein